jgi:dihydrolipoamide dehydrogenase
MQKFDVAVIGAGPGGYIAAIRCAQLGLKTVCIDNWVNHKGKPALGGTCLNVGCIPSKAVLDSSEQYYRLNHSLPDHGIHIAEASINVQEMMARKEHIVSTLTGGIETLFMKNKVTWLHGHGKLLSSGQVEVDKGEGSPEVVEAGHIIIATGSVPAELPAAPFDGQYIVDSTGALSFDEVPEHLGVIGGGVVGLELASVWSRLGSEVVILIRRDAFLPAVDAQLSQEALRLLREQGMDIRLSAVCQSVEIKDGKVGLTYLEGETERKLELDRLLVATGRKPNTTRLNADAVGLNIDERGFIEVDEHCRTNLPNIFAIGDVVRGPMLAHKASEEGVAVAERIAGQESHVNYGTIPWVIYTWPEIAWVGKTGEQLKNEGVEFRSGVFPFKANGRARAMNEVNGMVKIIADAKYDRILGVHILGPFASEMIAELVTAMEFGASAEDIARTVHAHPTLSETVHEAALAVGKRALHI